MDDVAAEVPDVLDRLVVAGDVEGLRHRRRLELVEEADPLDLAELLSAGHPLVEGVPHPQVDQALAQVRAERLGDVTPDAASVEHLQRLAPGDVLDVVGVLGQRGWHLHPYGALADALDLEEDRLAVVISPHDDAVGVADDHVLGVGEVHLVVGDRAGWRSALRAHLGW